MNYQERTYRNYIKAKDLIKFEVIEKETDLLILAQSNLYDKALASTLKHRGEIERYIETDEKFVKSYSPYRVNHKAPEIIKAMAKAAKKAKVGPMAAVAGALAEAVGLDLLPFSEEVIVENGGDLFLNIKQPRKVGVFAGAPPISEKIAIEVEPKETSFSVCCSSGTVGHSFSFGKADAVIVVAQSACLADAAATAIGNAIKHVADIEKGLKTGKKIRGLDGILIIKDDQIGALGKIKLVPI